MKQNSTSYVDKDVIQYFGNCSFWVYTDDYLPIIPKSYHKETHVVIVSNNTQNKQYIHVA